MNLIINVGSITNAQRGASELNRNGYKAYIKRIENHEKSKGCGYSLQVRSSDERPLEILQKGGITYHGAEWR